MKAGTAARIVYAVAIVAVLLVAAMPAIAMMSDLKGSALKEGTHAVYDLTKMDEETLAENIYDAIDYDYGCTIEYGDAKEDIDPLDVDALAARILASGETSATVKDSSGNVVIQESIAYRNAVMFGSRSGIIVPESYTKAVDTSVSSRFHSDDGFIDFTPAAEQTRHDGEISVEYAISIALYNMLGAYGCNYGLHIEAGYGSLAELTAQLDLDVVSFDYTLTTVDGTTVLTVTDCSVSEYGIGSIGNVVLELSDIDGCSMTMSCEGKLSDALQSSLKDGKLTVELNGDSHEMTAEESELFIKIVRALEGSA